MVNGLDGKEPLYAIHEVFYENDKPKSVTQEPCWIQGETILELKSDFELYKKAFDKPVLNYEDF